MIFELSHALAERMKQTPQSEHWHGEGNVLAHTGMVVGELHALPDYKALPRRQQELLTVAAWLHDIGKITQSRQVGDHIEAPNHAGVGSRMAREMLWRESLLCGTADSMQAREAISLLIRYHSFPPHAIDSPDAKVRLHRIAANGLLTPDFSVKLLCILAKADMKGRICEDKAEMLDQIALCEELAREEGCYEAPYAFQSELTRRAYLNGRDLWKE
ncbi:MAG: HD domain-containing protein, partial [Paramuribaculum sp.]|nr:HD domain-containing protein [Paramuribaculum sp.]